MKREHGLWLLSVGFALGSLSGCSTPLPPAQAPVEARATDTAPGGARPQVDAPAPSAPAPGVPRAIGEPRVASAALPAHLDPASAISRERSVYFEFDDSSVAPAYMALIENHAKYLNANLALTLRIEGHADERGGSEYNLALGQRRAESVARALRLLGVSAGRIEAVSFGEERPKAHGHDEAAWAQNRRADIAYAQR